MSNLNKLREPFPANDIEWFIGVTSKDKTTGLAIPFITNRAVQDRLDEVCGVDGWKNEFKQIRGEETRNPDGTITNRISHLCGISVWSEERGEWITKWDGADDTDIEALKGGLSSAMKRAAVQFGIGRYLYKMDSPWVEIEPIGKSYRMKPGQTLILPSWALPGGSGHPMAGEEKAVRVQSGNRWNSAPPQQANSNQAAPAQQPSSNSPARRLSDKQINRARVKAAAAGKTQEDIVKWISTKYGVESIEQLDRAQYDALCAALDQARA